MRECFNKVKVLKMNLEHLCQQTCQIVSNTAEFIRVELGNVQSNEIETKSLNSLVSYVDKQAERQLVAALQQLIPTATFLTEEETIAQEKGDYLWIIDPLDGTTNFLHQIPCFAVSVALQYKETTVIGVVYEVNRQECFYAWKEGGAYLNGQSISVSNNSIMQNAIIATGFPYYDYEQMDAYIATLKYCMLNTRGIRRLGAAAVDLAYVACGKFDTFFEYSLSPWDVAAGVLLVEEAGGRVTDFKGGTDYLYGKEIVAGSSRLFEEFAKELSKNFYGHG